MPDPRDEIAKWDRERVAAAVALSRERGSIADGPLPPNPQRWDAWTAEVVQAADEILRYRASRC